jgi:hypothetical protein
MDYIDLAQRDRARLLLGVCGKWRAPGIPDRRRLRRDPIRIHREREGVRDTRIDGDSGVALIVGLDGFGWIDEENGVRLLRCRLNRQVTVGPCPAPLVTSPLTDGLLSSPPSRESFTSSK